MFLEFERLAGPPAGLRLPHGTSIDVDDEVAIVLEVELAVAALAVVVGCIAVPHGVRCHGCSVVDDEVAVGLEVEAYFIIEADEGWACRCDVKGLAGRPLGVGVPFGYFRDG